MLIPLAGNERVQGMLRKQLQEWKDNKMDQTFDSDLFKIYQMLCGINIVSFQLNKNIYIFFSKFLGAQFSDTNQCAEWVRLAPGIWLFPLVRHVKLGVNFGWTRNVRKMFYERRRLISPHGEPTVNRSRWHGGFLSKLRHFRYLIFGAKIVQK